MSYSSANDDAHSVSDDEDSSYKRLVQTRMNNEEEDSIIDDSGEDLDNSASFESTNGKLKMRKRLVRPLDSESDSDIETDNTPDELSTLPVDHSNVAAKVGPLVSDSDSDIEMDHTPEEVIDPSNVAAKNTEQQSEPRKESPEESSSLLTSRKSARKKSTSVASQKGTPKSQTHKETHIEESDSDDDSEPRLQIESFTENPSEKTAPPLAQKSADDLSLSDKIGNNRISHQFEFNSEGILNSTSIHGTGQAQKNWRPSNAFQRIDDVSETSSGQSIEVLSDNSSDIIEVSSGEQIASPPKTPLKLPRPKNAVRQQTLHSFVKAKSPVLQPTANNHSKPSPLPLITKQEPAEACRKTVSQAEYETQTIRVENLETDFVKLQSMAENLDFEALPDKGQLVKDRLKAAKNKYLEEKRKLENMVVSEELGLEQTEQVPGAFANVAWEDIQAGANAVLPKTFGKQAMSTYNAQKAVTMDRLQQLHGALQTCPKEDDLEEDPKSLKVPLMPHQRRALAWLMFREKEKPSGGILADDMGLGKTLTMISLIVKTLQIEKADNDSDEENKNRNDYVGKYTKLDGGSLIVCPASLLNQWSEEIDRRLKRGTISYNVYHGPKRETQVKRLAEYDVVITTYSIVNNENDKKSALYRIKWRRIILDEAHQIRNYKAQTSEACCQLSGKSRWALTGTPMHNKELDMYALLKFLRCTPFDDLQVWKRWVGDKSRGGQERLHTVISSLMLRRTKVELMEKGALNCMPEKKWLLVKVELDKNELQVYHKVLIFSQTLFAQFLHQRAEKNQDFINHRLGDRDNDAPNEEYYKMREKLLKLNKVKNVSQHEILVLLLRLRQICCHPSLITSMLDETLEDVGQDDEECEELNLLEQLQKLNIEEEHEDEYKPTADSTVADVNADVKVNLKEATKGHLRPSDPIFQKERASSKIRHMLKVLKAEVLTKDDKAIIVSQWSSYLNLVAMHLKELDIEFDQLDGKVPVHKRMEMVNKFNSPKDPMRVLLLSLTAGGVGLNLVGANHLFLLDLHWNPQLENQAQDRIYRMGQKKPVFVYKFMAVDTIEERIKMLQEKKLAMAEGILTGTRQVVQSKLSLDDLRMIFGM